MDYAVIPVRFTINGREVQVIVEPRRLLADVLRDDLGLTGSHLGCEHGVCGACTVLVDGKPARSCLMIAPQAEGRTIRTVESLAEGIDLHPLQQAFQRSHGLQCGFCTPGILMTALVLDSSSPHDEIALRDFLSGNICRCTGYAAIVDAVREWLDDGARSSASTGSR